MSLKIGSAAPAEKRAVPENICFRRYFRKLLCAAAFGGMPRTHFFWDTRSTFLFFHAPCARVCHGLSNVLCGAGPSRFARALLLVLAMGGLPACHNDAAEPQSTTLPYVAPRADLSGEQLARVYCQACHRFPEPALLDRATWQQAVLPRMRQRLGLYEEGVTPDRLNGTGPGAQQIREAGIFPDTAALTTKQWDRIAAYILRAAPDSLPPQPERPPIRKGLSGFDVREASIQATVPMVSLVKIDEETARIYAGDFGQGVATLYALSSRTGRVLAQRPVGSAPSSLRLGPGSLLLADMRSPGPTDAPTGRLFRLPRASLARFQDVPELVLKGLQRPVHANVADLNQDGRDDIIVAEFGDKTGQLSWYERRGAEHFKKHTLKSAPGALRSCVLDLNRDGRSDVVALMAQGDEGIYAFYNEGGGQFREEALVRFPPSYGSSAFELVDFNDDGHADLLHASGDNADYAPIMKPYHGVRIFINDGQNNFDEQFFYPMNGTYEATAADYDQDGDQDIAAISFFPDYEKSPQESFVYLENQGPTQDGWAFEASTFEGSGRGRWLSMDRGDMDRDGDEDLVLGSFAAPAPSFVPRRQQARLRSKGAPVVILENKAR